MDKNKLFTLNLWERNTMAQIRKIWFDEDKLWAEFKDGRRSSEMVSKPKQSNPQQLGNYEIWGDNQYIHWPDLDEDISAETLVALSVHGLPAGTFFNGS